MFGHGFIIVNSHVVVNVDKASVESRQKLIFISFLLTKPIHKDF